MLNRCSTKVRKELQMNPVTFHPCAATLYEEPGKQKFLKDSGVCKRKSLFKGHKSDNTIKYNAGVFPSPKKLVKYVFWYAALLFLFLCFFFLEATANWSSVCQNRANNPPKSHSKKLTNTTVCPWIKESLKAANISLFTLLVLADGKTNQGDRFMLHLFLQCV